MNADDPVRKKRLGQYFTGLPVARLLAALANAHAARSIIDPMVGAGDMLRACLEMGSHPTQLVGIDLDPLAVAQAAQSLRDTNILLTCGDAFAVGLPDQQFDLVITNPPYIRYQSKADRRDIAVPTGEEIRQNLIAQIRHRRYLSAAARAALTDVVRRYPGTADIAVPSWILSAALVAENGTLAVVLPQAWLSRNYADPIREMIDSAFSVEVIVQDGDASWFGDAQVRTHLLVAKRRAIDGSLHGRSRIIVGRAAKALRNNGSLTGTLGSEAQVAAALRSITSLQPAPVTRGLAGWIEQRTDDLGKLHAGSLSPEIARVMKRNHRHLQVRSLASFGWRCGQGMRTGANEFFYVTAIGDDRAETATRWRHRSVKLPAECLLPAVRRQSDLNRRAQVTINMLTARLLNLRGWITSKDRAAALEIGVSQQWLTERYRLLPDDAGAWVAEVAASPLTEREPSKRIPELSAVATNVRTGRAGEPVSLWYHLPPLAPRHRPEIFIPRVCAARPNAYLNSDRAVVDANFATLWRAAEDGLPAHAMLAVLNSTWVWANLEQSCTVLGGGALKVEATDLRRIVVPDLDALAVEGLTWLGKRLDSTQDTAVLAEIDSVMSDALTGISGVGGLTSVISSIAAGGLRHRSRHPRASGPKAPAKIAFHSSSERSCAQ